MATSQASLVEQVIARCSERRFTGLLRVRTLEGKGELSFLSGIRDTVVFDASDGEEALQRLLRSTRQEFEAIPRLPPIDAHSEQPLAEAGELGKLRPVNLLRYCESQSITCTLDLYVAGKSVRLAYEVGELLGVEPETADISALLESKVGSYRINLPLFELPEAARPKVAPPAVQAAAYVRRPSAQDVAVVQPALAAASSARMAAAVQQKPSTAALAAAQVGAGALRADKPRPLADVAMTPLAPVALGGGSSATLPAARPARVDAPAPSSGGGKARPPALPVEPPRGAELRAEVESTPRSGGVATPKGRPPALPSEVAPSRPPSVVVAPDSARPQQKGPPPLEQAAPAAQSKERPEFLTVTKPSKRHEPAAADGARGSGSLEPWSPASKRYDEQEARQSDRPPARASGSSAFTWVLLALAVLAALAYYLLG